ncbi:cytochrome P450 [Streptomyces pluripotens]|uniref:Cytochrome P450 n=1 Tax=Streptomyces pluripotens TaxID=1355015 RepID=A0A221NZF4_9ACTN|nr:MULTISPECIES: cytochrome P450 [Streptomyces]ARP71030.1 cytochrome P450 [Streptomyces pluripotens]ASN25282.1 cytochrome P450 [Streptomyces pluripotens]KIE25919.1 cytochrome P450 [Streptomyces sp. MUSC 125]MCH0557206.1 cytochrome P450 [Streptomyces sp. MUM 16J]
MSDRRAAVSLLSRLRTAQGQADPFPLYAELRSKGPVVLAPWGGFLVTRFDLCDRIVRSGTWLEPDRRWREKQGARTRWSAFSAREIASTLPALNPPDHTRVRRAAGNFDRGTIDQLGHTVTRATDRLLDVLADRLRDGTADFAALVSEELPIAVIGDWLDLPRADWPRLRELTHEQVYTQELLPTASQLARSDVAMAELRDYFLTVVRDRRACLREDPVSRWITTWDAMEPDQDKADEAVYYLSLFVLLAALETSSTLLSTMVLRLVERPERWDLVASCPDLVPAFVEETLRFDPPSHVISRVAAVDCTLEGVDVRADDMVHLMVGAAHRDPARHHDPDRFDPHRKPAHLAFSGGIHYCLGAPLARLEAQTLLRRLVRRLPGLTLVRPPAMAPRVAFRRLLNLDVTLI